MERYEDYYIAMRRSTDDGHLWPDSTTIAVCPEDCRKKAAETDEASSLYHHKNPVAKVCVCHIEVEV
jgi:hypothetical protein